MAFWQSFWSVALIAAVAAFLILALAVTIGALADIRALFADIRSRHAGDAAQAPDEDAGQTA